MSRAGNRILDSVHRARTYVRGETTAGFIAHVPESVDVKAIRTQLGLSQGVFARRFGFTPAAVRDWEQQRRQPEQAARVLLLVIAHDPGVVERALAAGKRSQQRRTAGSAPG
jgi:putative transcriptional regulator